MGVDFVAYSSVECVPVPDEFCATRKKPAYQIDTKNIYASARQDGMNHTDAAAVVSLVCTSAGLTLDSTGNAVCAEELELDDAKCAAFQERFGKDPRYIAVNWYTNTMYLRTAATLEARCGRSYSGFSDFIRELDSVNRGPITYKPPAIIMEPEYGFVSAERAEIFYKDLFKLKSHFIDATAGDIEAKQNVNEHSWFFREMFTCVDLARNSGILLVS